MPRPSTPFSMPERQPGGRRPLAWAFGVAVLLHLLAGLTYTILAVWVATRPDQAPEWAKELVRPSVPQAALAKTEPPTEPQWQEINLDFVEIDPANAVEKEPKDARFYSSANTLSGQPVPSDRNQKDPQITGTQKNVAKTFDTVRPSQPKPAEQPTPPDKDPEKETARETAKTEKPREERKPQPAGGPKEAGETQLAAARPDARVDKVQDEQKAVEPQAAGAPRRKPIKRLSEAREQKGIVLGEKMMKEGGSPRISISPSFDVRSSPFGDYDLRMVAAVQERWWALLEERRFSLERTGKVVLKFQLHADGTISQLQTVQSDVGDTLGFTCEAALMGASPFGRWPVSLKAQAADPREITFTFHYY